MEYFQVRYDSRVVIYEHKMFIRLATGSYLLQSVHLTRPRDSQPTIGHVLRTFVVTILEMSPKSSKTLGMEIMIVSAK